MNKSTKFAIGGSAIALTLTLILTGCVGGTEPTPDSTTKPTSTSTSTPIDVVDGYEVGQAVDADAAAALNAAGTDLHAYPLADGTFVIVDENAPLPEAVQNDANSKAVAVTAQYPSSVGGNFSEFADAVSALTAATGGNTGKSVIGVWYTSGYINSTDTALTNYYFIRGNSGGKATNQYFSREEAQAEIDRFLGSVENPEHYVVIWSK